MSARDNHSIVTGGAGFIGSNLAQALLARGHRVTVIDDFSTGREQNLSGLSGPGGLRTERLSITDLEALRPHFEGVRFVFHQAALPSVPRSVADPFQSNLVNIQGTLNVLLAARDSGVEKVVFASSSSIYGDTPVLPKHELMMNNPQSPYAVTKVAGEYYCQVFSRVYGLPTACLRYFNVFGPRQDPNSEYAAVIPLFISRMRAGQPVTIFGDGAQTRDFTFVKDVVQANIKAAESDAQGIYNVAGGRRVSINELAQMVATSLGAPYTVNHADNRAGDVRDSLADISKAGGFGFHPEYTLENGITETVRSMT